MVLLGKELKWRRRLGVGGVGGGGGEGGGGWGEHADLALKVSALCFAAGRN